MTSLLAFVLLCGLGANDVYLERARELHAKYPLIDGHNDLPWRMRNLDRINPMSLDISKRLDSGQTDIPRLREGGVGAQFWSVYIPVSLQGEQAVQTTKEQIYLVYRLARTYPDDFEIAWTANDVERIFAKGKIASLIGMEGGHSINSSIETLREMYRLGARYMTLTHSSNTPWADSATDESQHNGLTEFGKEIVREMNRLGMLVDLSHVSAKTMHDTLDIAEAPVIFSHSGAMAVCDHVRNVPDDILLRLKKNGGVVMVVIFRPYNSQKYKDWSEERRKYQQELSAKGMAQNEIQQALKNWEKEKPAPDATLSDVADHIDHIKKISGIDHIGIGSDFDGGVE